MVGLPSFNSDDLSSYLSLENQECLQDIGRTIDDLAVKLNGQNKLP